jgi:hypothetical protein
MADIYIKKVIAETDKDLEKELSNIEGRIIQCQNTMPGNRRNREFEVIWHKE